MIYLLYFLITPILIVAKLTGCVAWSWVWVLAPLWAPALVFVVIFSVIFIALCVVAAYEYITGPPKPGVR